MPNPIIPTTVEGLVPVNGSRIRQWRQRRSLTQQQLADKCGMSRSYLADIERGDRRPRPVYAAAIAGHLNVEMSEILTVSGQ